MKSDLRSNFWGSTSLPAPSALVVTMWADLGCPAVPSPICLGFAPMTSRCLGGRADLCRVGGERGNFLGFWFSEMPGRTSTGWLFLENNKIWRGPKKSSFFGLGKNCALWNQSCVVQNSRHDAKQIAFTWFSLDQFDRVAIFGILFRVGYAAKLTKDYGWQQSELDGES